MANYKFIDMSGQRFGRLIVMHRETASGRPIYWQCRCDCGTEKVIAGTSIREGLIVSCGCFNKERRRQIKQPMAGKQFGRLTVLDESPKRYGRNILWNCLCKCGTKKAISGNSLRRGVSQSCGCLKADLSAARNVAIFSAERSRALNLGQKHYSTSQQCKYGHISMRFASSGGCIKCTRMRDREFRNRNKDATLRDERIDREILSDKYLRRCIGQQTGLKHSLISKNILQSKRYQVSLYRSIKDTKNVIKTKH